MKRLCTLVILIFFASKSVFAYRIFYAEQWYELYHSHLAYTVEDEFENIYYLEEALKSPFSNPLYAMTKIEDKTQWEAYRYLFKMHVNLTIIRTYIRMADRYDKKKAYFYNQPWKEENLRSLEFAEKYYNLALKYWDEVLVWTEKLNDAKFNYLVLESIMNWQDEKASINNKSLDFKVLINSHLTRLNQVRADFEAMDENTY